MVRHISNSVATFIILSTNAIQWLHISTVIKRGQQVRLEFIQQWLPWRISRCLCQHCLSASCLVCACCSSCSEPVSSIYIRLVFLACLQARSLFLVSYPSVLFRIPERASVTSLSSQRVFNRSKIINGVCSAAELANKENVFCTC